MNRVYIDRQGTTEAATGGSQGTGLAQIKPRYSRMTYLCVKRSHRVHSKADSIHVSFIQLVLLLFVSCRMHWQHSITFSSGNSNEKFFDVGKSKVVVVVH